MGISVYKAGFRYTEWVFRDLTLRVEPGEIAAILGPNGRGKTTLLKAVLGLLPLDEGSVEHGGNPGYVPQSAQMVFAYKVIDMVLMGRARHVGAFGSPRREDYEIARHCLDRLGIRRFEDRLVTRLSGGERQLVLIARALASGCRTILLDEPASALDFRNQQVILDTLRSLAREHGMTVLFSSHYPQHATCLADKVLLMHGAGSHQFGDTAQILTEENLRQLYGIEMRSVEFTHNGSALRTFVPVFGFPDRGVEISGGVV